MYFSVSLVVLISLFVGGTSEELVSWNMGELCGAEISKYYFAGEVYFDAETLQNNEYDDECKLTITPATLDGNGGNIIMFYFTVFEFQSDCDIINITIRDGRHRTSNIVQGLPRYVCGMNSTLTGQYFSTSGESFHIQINRKEHWSNYNGHFRLKFITHNTGNCDESDVYQCPNGHCIPLVYNCSENIKACGEASRKCVEITAEELQEWFSKVIRYLFILIGCICIICLLKAMCKKSKRKCGEVADAVEGCFRDIRLKCADCRQSVNLSRFPKPRLPNFIRSRLRSNAQETSDELADDSSTTEAVINPAYSEDQIHQNVQSPPSTVLPQSYTSQIEPPSYEEVMASSTHSLPSLQPEDPAPFYEEILSQNHISTSFHTDEYSIRTEGSSVYNNDIMDMPEADDIYFDRNERIMTSNRVIQSSLDTDTSSVLNNYLCDFAVELSDNYSTDSDWDSEGGSTVLPQEQQEAERIMTSNTIIQSSLDMETSSVLNNYLCDFAVELSDDYSTDTDWDSQSGSTLLSIEQQTAVTQTIPNESDWDSDGGSAILSQEQQTAVTQTVPNDSDWDSEGGSAIISHEQQTAVTQTVPNDSDWDSEGGSAILSQEQQTAVTQTIPNDSDWDSEGGSAILSHEQQTAVTQTTLTDSDWDSEGGSAILSQEQQTNVTQTIPNDSDGDLESGSRISAVTQSVPSVGSQSNTEISVPPPSYDEAVPPPYYYDYIANVGRYKQDSVTESATHYS